MRLSKKAEKVESSLTRYMFNLCGDIPDVIDLTLGDPDLPPDEKIKSSACAAINDGKTRYSENAGILPLREAIAGHIKREYGLSPDPASEIVVTVGGMEALYLAFACTLDAGDEVLIPAPYYVNYLQMTNLCGGVPVIINTDENSGFVPTKEQLESAITPKTVAIVVNTPSNPTGAVWSKKAIDDLCEVAKKYDLTVISDEVYSPLVYNGRHESVLTRPGMKDRTIFIDSISKRFAMTGYRLGYAYAPSEMVLSMTRMQENIAACAPLPSQYAAVTAYRECSENTELREIFRERVNYMASEINKTGKLFCRVPDGTFYLFVNIEKTGMDSFAFCLKLLKEAGVAVAPGITYGEAYDNYIRIACTADISLIKVAADRIKRFLETL